MVFTTNTLFADLLNNNAIGNQRSITTRSLSTHETAPLLPPPPLHLPTLTGIDKGSSSPRPLLMPGNSSTTSSQRPPRITLRHNVNYFSTTSTDYWWSTQRNFFSTTCEQLSAINQRDPFSTTSADFYANASSTIPKTYSNNTFTGSNTFSGAGIFNGTLSFVNATGTSLFANVLTGSNAAFGGTWNNNDHQPWTHWCRYHLSHRIDLHCCFSNDHAKRYLHLFTIASSTGNWLTTALFGQYQEQPPSPQHFLTLSFQLMQWAPLLLPPHLLISTYLTRQAISSQRPALMPSRSRILSLPQLITLQHNVTISDSLPQTTSSLA